MAEGDCSMMGGGHQPGVAVLRRGDEGGEQGTTLGLSDHQEGRQVACWLCAGEGGFLVHSVETFSLHPAPRIPRHRGS